MATSLLILHYIDLHIMCEDFWSGYLWETSKAHHGADVRLITFQANVVQGILFALARQHNPWFHGLGLHLGNMFW